MLFPLKKQSAFSLIEVLVSLLLLSTTIVLTAEVVLKNKVGYWRSTHAEKSVLVLTALSEVLRLQSCEQPIAAIRQKWQKKLQAIYPETRLSIKKSRIQNSCVYTVELLDRPVHFQIVAAGAV